MNFGETLALWYLRLNGFFPLSNFVVHQGQVVPRSADCDILAIRPPYVYEEIGGQPIDWDNQKFEQWGLDLRQDTIGLIIEVKTGYENQERRLTTAIQRAFQQRRLTYDVPRLGLWEHQRTVHVVQELLRAPSYRDENQPNLVIAKLLVAEYFPRVDNMPPCFQLTFEAADHFINTRMHNYIQRKYPDRTFFPSDLIQYVIWRQRHI